jgi:type IV secretion system protein VirB6
MSLLNPTIFRTIGSSADSALTNFVSNTSGAIITTIALTAVSLTTFYYVLNGFMIIMGKVEAPFQTFLMSAAKFLLIAAFALNITNYSNFVVEAVDGLEEGLTAAFSGQSGATGGGMPILERVDRTLGIGLTMANSQFSQASLRDIDEIGAMVGDFIVAAIIAASTIIIVVPAGAMIIVAKVVLALMLGIGPLFILMLMWPITKQFFDRWMGMVITAIFQIALIGAVLTLSLSIYLRFMPKPDPSLITDSCLIFFTCTTVAPNDVNHTLLAITLLVVTLVMKFLLSQVSNYASQLGGGISTAAINFGQMAATAINPARAVANTVNRTSTKMGMDGREKTSSMLGHLSKGRSGYNPAYRQYLSENKQQGWGRKKGGDGEKVK